MEKKNGRPLAEIDKNQFERLCGLQCTKSEICAYFHLTDKTLERWCKRNYKMSFSDVFSKKRGIGKVSLRRIQFRQAEKSPAMAIWLGKQWLGQSDNPVPESKSDYDPVARLREFDRIAAENNASPD